MRLVLPLARQVKISGKAFREKVFLDSPHADVREHQKEPTRTRRIFIRYATQREGSANGSMHMGFNSYPRFGGKLYLAEKREG